MKRSLHPFLAILPEQSGKKTKKKCYLFLSLGKGHFRRLLQTAKTKSLTFLKEKQPLIPKHPRLPKTTSSLHSTQCQSENNCRLGHEIQTPNQFPE